MRFKQGLRIDYKNLIEDRCFDLDKNGDLVLKEQTDYVIEFVEEPKENLKSYINNDVFNWITERAGILNFYNYVGISKFCGCRVNIQSSKIGPQDFERMLIDITECIASLPFDFNSPTYLPFDRTEMISDDVLYHNFIYLRYIMLQIERQSRLEPLIHRIIHNPNRLVYKEEINRDISLACSLNRKTIQRIFERNEYLASIGFNHPLAQTSLGKCIQRVPRCKELLFPQQVLDQQIKSTIDTSENRFIKYFLRSCLDTIALFKEKLLLKESYLNTEIEIDAIKMEEQLNQLLTHNFFFDVGELTRIPLSSQVLQKRDGYREVFEHFSKMNLAMNFPIESKDLKKIIDNKDIATLYEYWVFFRVAEILECLVGQAKKAKVAKYDEKRAFLDYKIRLKYKNGAMLYYNKSFYGSKPFGRTGSYSTTLRPDIALKMGDKWFFFDAKFKYDTVWDFFSREEDLEQEEREEERTKSFKKGDLYKMHTYRDAIHDSHSVWIIYPGNEFRFFSEEHGRIIDITDFHNQAGVGAIPLQPNKEEHGCEGLEMILREVLISENGN